MELSEKITVKGIGEYERRVRISMIGKHGDETIKKITPDEARELARCLLNAAAVAEETPAWGD